MPSTSQSITKPSVIDEFISTVMDAAKIGRITSSVYPTYDYVFWDNGSMTYSGPFPTIDTSPLVDENYNLGNPTTAELSSLVYANEILNLLRSYAYNTTVIRRVRYGKYWIQYSNGQGTRTGVPSNDPAHAPWGYQGTMQWGFYDGNIDGSVYPAHLNTDYRVSNPNSVSGPTTAALIDGSDLTDFFNNLRNAANPNTNGSDIVDLRICHSSCHNNCHSSRGRR